jgi:hypothetical protein
MIKKRFKRTSYLSDNKTFTTFKAMKTYAYFNTGTNGTKEGYELADDEIIRTYVFKKQERRILCIKTYDKEKELINEFNKRQLNLFENG